MNLHHLLLSIPPGEHPPTHYQLLGLADFESDEEVIVNAHRRQCRFVRTHMLRFPDETQQLLNEITEAKVCLCDPARRRDYERKVRKLLEESNGSASSYGEASGSRAARLHKLESSLNDESLSAPSWELPKPVTTTAAATGTTEWVVGSGADCDIRVRAPWVSRRHCQIRLDGQRVYVKDLKSTNGTYVNGRLLEAESRIRDSDIITLGKKTRLPWPLPADCTGADLEVYSIGRSPECDYVINDKSVSSLHAQLIIEGEVILLEDLSSLNGTRVGRLSNRIERCELEPHLSVFFGAKKVFAKTLIDSVREQRHGD